MSVSYRGFAAVLLITLTVATGSPVMAAVEAHSTPMVEVVQPEISPDLIAELSPEELEAIYGEGWKSIVGCGLLGLATHWTIGVACRILTTPQDAY